MRRQKPSAVRPNDYFPGQQKIRLASRDASLLATLEPV